jgi:4-aminobutyrate aminotransferase-like enzyme
MGQRLLRGLRQLAVQHPLIGDVRGSGFFAGVELVENRETLAPAAREAAIVAQRMREHGVLLGTDGPWHNVVKIRGPLQFQNSDVDALVDEFHNALEGLES